MSPPSEGPRRALLHSAPDPAAGQHHRPTPPMETPGHSQASLGQSLVGSLPLSPGSWCTRFCLCPPRVCFPVLCKFWHLCGGANGDLLQEGLCHTQVCIQSPCPCGSPLLTRSSIGDAHTQELHELYIESRLAVTLIHRPCECA